MKLQMAEGTPEIYIHGQYLLDRKQAERFVRDLRRNIDSVWPKQRSFVAELADARKAAAEKKSA